MLGRRITYISLLIGAAIYHFAYGQYVTNYMLLFLLCLPVLSLLLTLPASLLSIARLSGSMSVRRGAKSSVCLELGCRFFLPPEGWRVTLEEQNLFIDKASSVQNIRIGSASALKRDFEPDTSRLGTIRYQIKKARIYDYLGLFTLPVKKSGSFSVTVLPGIEKPLPEPELEDTSSAVLKPKPLGFSEEHELRPYRAGDPLNLIHWKLSVKLDEMIVREPQELIRKKILLSVELPYFYEDQQSVIEQLRYLSEQLTKREIPYKLVFGDQMLTVSSDDDFSDFIRTVLCKPMRMQPAAKVAADGDTLVYHIRPGRGVSA